MASEARNQDNGRASVIDQDKIKRTKVSDGVRWRIRLLDEIIFLKKECFVSILNGWFLSMYGKNHYNIVK